MNTRILAFALLLCGVLGCTTTDRTDAAIASQRRADFEEHRLLDPALGVIPPSIRTRELFFAATLPGSHTATMVKGEDVQATASFTSIGPWNVAGRTRAFVIDVTDASAQTLLAGGVSGGLWRSQDAGKSWTLTTPPDKLHNVTSLVQDNRNGKSNIWYYGTGESYGNSAQITGNGIWRSIDGGRNFVVLPSTISSVTPSSHAFAYSWRLVMDPNAETEVVLDATTRHGIWRTDNAGNTWSQVLSADSYFADVAVTSDGVFYATLSSFNGYSNSTSSTYGIFRSTDGKTWVNISPPDLPKALNRAVIGIVPGTDKVFIIAETPGVGARGQFALRTGIREEWHSLWTYEFVSGDGSGGGGRWENRSANIPLLGGRSGDYFSQGGYDMFVRVSPHDTNSVWLGGTNLYRSLDAFRSTTHIAQAGGYGWPTPAEKYPSWPNHHPDNHELLFHPTDGNVVYSTNDGGMMRSDAMYADTVKWVSLNTGYVTTQHYAVSMRMDSATDDAMGGMQDNGTWATNSTDPEHPWILRNGGDGAYSAFADHGRTLYVSTQQGYLRRVNLDASGAEVNRTRIDPAGPAPADYLFVNPFAIDPNAEQIMYLPAGTIVYRNTDLSEIPVRSADSTSVNWDTLGSTRIAAGQITAIVASVAPAHIVYYGTSTGRVYRLNDAHTGQPLSIDVSNGLPGNYINAITIDPRDAQKVIVAYSNYGVLSIYATSDGGQSWNAVSGNLEEHPSGAGNGPAVLWVDVVPFDVDHDVYVAATSTGLYMTTELNAMSTVWTQIATEEIGNVPIDMVVARHLDKRILVGTHGRGVFIGHITSLPPSTGIPTLISPPDLARGIYADTTVTWNVVPDAVSYRVEVSSREDFSDSVIVVDGVNGTSAKISGLLDGLRRYFWRVTAFGGGGKGEPSLAWSFYTAVRPPTLLEPVNRAENVPGLPVRLVWERVPGAVQYHVQVAPNLAFTTILDEAAGLADTTYGARNLASGVRYFWRARAMDPDTISVWSVRSQFITGVLTTVDEWEGAQDVRVWPNPATDVVRIQWPDVENGTVEILDVRGNVVYKDSAYEPSRPIGIKQLAAGVYNVRVALTTKRYVGKFSIVR